MLAVLVLGLLPRLAWAWGAEGHRIVGWVAEDLLDAPTRAAVQALAGQESLADMATWMDEERPRLRHALPGSTAWHYENIPVCGGPAPEACPHGDCASKALERYRAVLADRHANPAQRLLALRIVVHLVGDVHQPLHAADDNDRGGNDVAVGRGGAPRGRARVPGHRHNLHAVWDVDFVHRAVQGERDQEFAADLVAAHAGDLKRLEGGTFQSWINESHTIATEFVYGHLSGFACGRVPPDAIALSEPYREEGARIVRERLAVAGIRLAGVLRAALTRP